MLCPKNPWKKKKPTSPCMFPHHGKLFPAPLSSPIPLNSPERLDQPPKDISQSDTFLSSGIRMLFCLVIGKSSGEWTALQRKVIWCTAQYSCLVSPATLLQAHKAAVTSVYPSAVLQHLKKTTTEKIFTFPKLAKSHGGEV